MLPDPDVEKALSRDLLDVLIRAGVIAVLMIFCFRIFSPFLDLMLWSLILGITLYPVQVRVKNLLGNRDGLAATLIVLVVIGILMLPAYLLGASIADSLAKVMDVVKSGNFSIPAPPDSIANWPLVGKPVLGIWTQAMSDLPEFIHRFIPQIKDASLVMLSKLAGAGVGFILFIFAVIIAGIFAAYGEMGQRSAVQIVSAFCGAAKGPAIARLCTATIRAVALGVVGIAFIQMLLVGIGFVVMDVPGAGLLALAVLLLGIMQLPATLITLPVIAFVLMSEGASTGTIVFAVYVFVAGMVDNVLKPLLLGRGVDVPMPVVLIGALGGMVMSGILGLFIGPVILAVGYRLFWQWVEDQQSQA
ncbi:AI-2E family transporter [Pseudomonas koreensis]|uniref:AI-2E family transporter n=1 Tax=Pseudomonas koreensis TaxID=198620 RepID=UPI0021C90DD1|nr:AI-2E family transporter [Pseudomonas koreensis]MCU0074635.1 AI-2E family transporter [Pseudomonas koreensis]